MTVKSEITEASMLNARKPPLQRQSQSFLDQESILESYAQIAKTMPECSERSILLLQTHFEHELKKHKRGDKKSLSLIKDEQIKPIIENLKKQLETDSVGNKSIINSISKLELLIENHRANLDDICDNISNILQEIRPLDVEQMLELLDKTKEKTEFIRDKDVILMLGGTGTGKSTTILFLAGIKLGLMQVEGLKHIGPVDQLKK